MFSTCSGCGISWSSHCSSSADVIDSENPLSAAAITWYYDSETNLREVVSTCGLKAIQAQPQKHLYLSTMIKIGCVPCAAAWDSGTPGLLITVACVCVGTVGLVEACACGMAGLLAACSCAGTAGLLELLAVCDCGGTAMFASVVYDILFAWECTCQYNV